MSARAEKPDRPRKKLQKPGIVVLIVGFATALLLLSTLLTVLAYRFIVEPYYVGSLQGQLADMEEQLIALDFDPGQLIALQTDIRILVYDDATGEITYVDNYFYSDGLPDAVSVATPPEKPKGDEEMEAEREYNAVRLLKQAVFYTLNGQDGSYFAADNWGKAPNGMPLESKALYLNGVRQGHYYSLCLTVESVNASINLALRFSICITVAVWMLGMVVCTLVYRRLTATSRAVVESAERMAELDFSVRCPEGITREFDDLSRSANKMSDQLQSYLSQLKQTNQRLSEELAESDRQHRLTQELIANLSHDLKTPIAIISGYAEGLTEGVAKTDEQRERYANMILQESGRMQQIVSQLLALGRLESGQLPLEYTDFDLSELVQEILDGFQREMERAGVTLECALTAPLPVHSDYLSIRQVVINYVQNAVYHINGGNRICAVTERVGDRAVFRIANCSAPIVGEQAQKIWDKLYRGDSARTREHGEVGLGLCIVKGNMERLGQGCGFRNLDDGMVEFYIELPLAELDPAP